jgi:predicted transcriptional regulator
VAAPRAPGDSPLIRLTLRDEILFFVREYPGIHAREVERRLGLASRLASYHLDALAQEGLLARHDDSGYARYFPIESTARLSPRELAFISAMRSPPALQIVLLLLSEGEMTPSALAETLSLARPSVSYHMNALLEEEIVLARESGRLRIYALRDKAYVARMLASFHPLPGDLDAFSSLWDDLIGK